MTRPVALLGGKRGRLLLALVLLPLAALATYVGARVSNGDLAEGRQLYLDNCASCHGAQLEGQANWQRPLALGRMPAPPHDAEGHTWHHSDRLLFRYVKLGGSEALGNLPGFRSAMPGFGGILSDQEIRDVLSYIKSHWPEEMREYQRTVTERDTE